MCQNLFFTFLWLGRDLFSSFNNMIRYWKEQCNVLWIKKKRTTYLYFLSPLKLTTRSSSFDSPTSPLIDPYWTCDFVSNSRKSIFWKCSCNLRQAIISMVVAIVAIQMAMMRLLWIGIKATTWYCGMRREISQNNSASILSMSKSWL